MQSIQTIEGLIGMLDIMEIVIHRVVMPLQMRFETSFGV